MTSLPTDGTDAAKRALAAIDAGARAIMVLGGAGTGKTTFLHELRKTPRGRQVFLAPTGVAAIQVGGQTIHSFFGIPPRLLNPDEVKPRVHIRRLLKKLDRVVIDEISMVRADLLDAVDISLRIARDRPEPFGGVQMVLVGDFLQLPPVVPRHEEELLSRMGYEGPFAFNAKASPSPSPSSSSRASPSPTCTGRPTVPSFPCSTLSGAALARARRRKR